MIDVNKLKLGDIVYKVTETNNCFTKKKITFTDPDGIEWYRYDRPDYTYKITEFIFCGYVEHKIVGETNTDISDFGMQTDYFFKKEGEPKCYEYSAYDIDEEFFYTQEKADLYVKQKMNEQYGLHTS